MGQKFQEVRDEVKQNLAIHLIAGTPSVYVLTTPVFLTPPNKQPLSKNILKSSLKYKNYTDLLILMKLSTSFTVQHQNM